MTRHGETFGVRVAGLPVTALDCLSSRELRDRLATLLDSEQGLTVAAERLSARCHDVIARLDVQTAKPKLVALRRAVHQRRDPIRLLADPTAAAALGEDLVGEITEFGRRVRDHRALLTSLPAQLAAAEETVHRSLLEVAADPLFDKGLAHASPTLHGRLRRRPRRQELIRLAVYVARAAAKTSPFTTFTANGLGRFVAHGPALRWTGVQGPCSLAELDLSVITRLVGTVHDVPLRLNPSASWDSDVVRFLGNPPEEPVMSLALTPALRHSLRLAADRPTLAELVASFPASYREKAVAYLFSLIHAGLLIAPPPVDAYEPDPLSRFPELNAVQEQLRDYAETAGADRVGHGEKLQCQLADLGVTAPLRDTVLEHSVLPGTVMEAGMPAWSPMLDDLAAACRMLAVFDQTLPFKLAVAHFLASRHPVGARVPFLSFYQDFLRHGGEALRLRPAALSFGPTSLVDTLSASPTPAVRELADLVVRTRRALPDPAAVDQVLASAPDWLRLPGSVAVYAQFDGDNLIVNTVNSGFGRGRVQIHRQLRELGCDPLPVEAVHADGTRYAEFADPLGSSLNHRTATLPTRLDYPPSASLEVGLGPDGLPILVQYGVPVRPVHVGLSFERQLPPAMAFMIEAFGENPTLLRPEQPLVHDAAADRHGVVATPPLRLGAVVLRRATWLAPPPTLPRRAAGESDADFLLRLAGWLRRHGIPTRLFVSAFALRGLNLASVLRDRGRKPMYVDIGSPPLVSAFERLTRDPDTTAVFSEVSPDPEQALADHEGRRRVTEHVIELDCQRR